MGQSKGPVAGIASTSGGALAASEAGSRYPRARQPRAVVVGLLESPRKGAADACPSDGAAVDAGTMLARGFRCSFEALHVPRVDDDSSPVEDRLLALATERQDPLLVLGCRSTSAPGRGIFPGRTTRGVLAALSCPVWIQRGPWRPPGRILAALSEFHADQAVFDLALDIAISLGASLDIVHCREHPSESARSMSAADLELLADVARQRFAGERRSTSEVGILNVAGPAKVALAPYLERADLTVLGRGSRRGLGHVLQDLLLFRSGPFVVVPDHG